jgi:hypothetical protein
MLQELRTPFSSVLGRQPLNIGMLGALEMSGGISS